MVSLETFNDEERDLLARTPFYVLAHVGGADGKVDDGEREALVRALAAERPDSGLGAEILSFASANVTAFSNEAIIGGPTPVEALRQSAGILDGRLPLEEAQRVKASLIAIGEHIAQASGGILGFGSRVSGEESVALREVGRALRLHTRRSLAVGGPSFSSILVPLDGTHHAEAALKPAGELAEKFGARVTLLQVSTSIEQLSRMVAIDGFITPGTVDAMVEAGEAERGAAESYLAQVSTAMGGADWTPVVREGDPATVICDEAERAGADLVVMASEGRSVIGRIFDPSTAEAVVRRSKAPVLVIPVGHDED